MTEPLTPEEVDALPEGTLITVTWSGGNGPHDYVVTVNDHGQRFAEVPGNTNERMRFYNPLRGIWPDTRVWLRTEPTAPAHDHLGRNCPPSCPAHGHQPIVQDHTNGSQEES